MNDGLVRVILSSIYTQATLHLLPIDIRAALVLLLPVWALWYLLLLAMARRWGRP